MDRFCFAGAILASFLFFAVLPSEAAPKKTRIRTGVVTFELTQSKPPAEGKSPVLRTSSPAWAVITLVLDPYRAASVFDYALRKDGTEYKCLDIAEGTEDPFRGTLRNYRSVESGKICRMVFAVPSIEDEYEIIFKLKSGEEDPVKINVKDPLPEAVASMTLQDTVKLIGPERTPHKDLSPADAALKHVISAVMLEFEAHKETLPAEKAAQYKAPQITDDMKKAKEEKIKTDPKYEIFSPDVKETEALLSLKETAGELSKNFSVKLSKSENGWVVDEMKEQEEEKKKE